MSSFIVVLSSPTVFDLDGGTVLISSCKCNFSIYLDIQAITTIFCLLLVLSCLLLVLSCLLLILYVLILLFIHFSTLQPLSWKVSFSGTQKPTLPTVFNLEASDWVHCEEETGAYYQLSQNTYKLFFFLHIFKIVNFAFKKYTDLKKLHKIYY